MLCNQNHSIDFELHNTLKITLYFLFFILYIYSGAGLLESHLRANGPKIQAVTYDMQSSSVAFERVSEIGSRFAIVNCRLIKC